MTAAAMVAAITMKKPRATVLGVLAPPFDHHGQNDDRTRGILPRRTFFKRKETLLDFTRRAGRVKGGDVRVYLSRPSNVSTASFKLLL